MIQRMVGFIMPFTSFRISIALGLIGILLLIIVANILPQSDVSAVIITVDDDGPADYSTIQNAVNASNEGDTVHIMNGTYFEHVVVNSSVTLVGETALGCIIDAGGEGIALLLENASISVSGLTVTGGGCCDGAGMKVRSGHVTISNVTVVNNRMTGLHIGSSDSVVRDTAFINNSIGMVWFGTSNSFLENSTFIENGVALSLAWARDSEIRRTRFQNNGFGIGVDFSSYTTVDNCSFNGDDYGILVSRSQSTLIHHSHITGTRRGIFAYELSQNTTVTSCSIQGNREFGIYSDVHVNATDIWWGNDTGPYHEFLHPGGGGDNITLGVDFYPWNGTVFLEPRLLITLSPSNHTVSGEIIIEGTAEDPDGSQVSVWYSIDGGNWTLLNGTDPWRLVWNSTSFANGTYVFSFRAFDEEYYSAVSSLTFLVEHGNGGGGNGDPNGGDDDPADGDDGNLELTKEQYIFVIVLGALMIPLSGLAYFLYAKGKQERDGP